MCQYVANIIMKVFSELFHDETPYPWSPMYIFNNLGVFYLSIWDISIPILVIKWFLECDVTYSTVPTARVVYSSYSGYYILLKCSFNQLENTINENKNRTENKWLTDHQVVTWYPSLSHGENLNEVIIGTVCFALILISMEDVQLR